MRWRWIATAWLAACAAPVEPSTPGQRPSADPRAAEGTSDGWVVDDRARPLRRLTQPEVYGALATLFPGVDPAEVAHRLDEEHLPGVGLPPDARLRGLTTYAEVQSTSELWLESFAVMARGFTSVALDERPWFLPVGCGLVGTPATEACAGDALLTFADRAWRRPLTDGEAGALRAFLGDRWSEGTPRDALTLGVQAVLLSPQFLYVLEPSPTPGETVRVDAWSLAARVALFLTDTVPDEALRAAAADGSLLRDEVLEAQARRLLVTPGARFAVRNYGSEWLQLDVAGRWEADWGTYGWLADDPSCREAQGEVYCEDQFSNSLDHLRHAMMAEALDFVEGAWFDWGGTLEVLLTSRRTRASAILDRVYTFRPPEEAPPGPPREVLLPADQRAGLLTLSGVLAGRSHLVQPAPVLRGLFVQRNLLCGEVGPPPPGVVTALAPVEEGSVLTNRERHGVHATNPACAGCHASIDPLGFAFEHYDAVGAWRETDAGRPVDASGVLVGTDVDGPFDGAIELAHRLASSRQVHDCAVTWMMRYALGREATAADAPAVDGLQERFHAGGGDLRELMVQVVLSAPFRERSGGAP